MRRKISALFSMSGCIFALGGLQTLVTENLMASVVLWMLSSTAMALALLFRTYKVEP